MFRGYTNIIQAPLLPTRRCLRSCARAVAARYTGRWEGPGGSLENGPRDPGKRVKSGDFKGYNIQYIYIYIYHIFLYGKIGIYI